MLKNIVLTALWSGVTLTSLHAMDVHKTSDQGGQIKFLFTIGHRLVTSIGESDETYLSFERWFAETLHGEHMIELLCNRNSSQVLNLDLDCIGDSVTQRQYSLRGLVQGLKYNTAFTKEDPAESNLRVARCGRLNTIIKAYESGQDEVLQTYAGKVKDSPKEEAPDLIPSSSKENRDTVTAPENGRLSETASWWSGLFTTKNVVIAGFIAAAICALLWNRHADQKKEGGKSGKSA